MRTSRFLACTLALAVACSAFSQRQTNQVELNRIAQQARAMAEAKKEEAIFLARMHGLATKGITPNGMVFELMSFQNGKPIYALTENVNAALSTRANRVHPGGVAGLSLTGLGVLLGIWDGGTVRTTHQEYSGRVTNRDGEARSGDHASHVAGTMIASGVSASAKGMSFQATLDSYGWNSDDAEMASAAAAGLRLSNHSYGYITGWYNNGLNWYWYGDTTVSTAEDNAFGFYDSTAQTWDNIAYNAPFYLISKSAGNDRNQGPGGQPISHYDYDNGTASWVLRNDSHGLDGNAGYDSISYNGTAKNILSVGAVNDVLNYTGPGSVTMSSFSGWGPTDDGRIKPDLVGNGVSLTSCFGSGDTAYGIYSGTSMSSPNVTGSLGLLVQHHRNLNAGGDMLAATLKGLAIHTADEAGSSTGPDYAFGWGLLNIEQAALIISQDVARPETLTQNSLSNGGTSSTTVYADGTKPLRVTICWTDPAGTPAPWSLDPSTRMLVNDLDLRVTGPGGTAMPWVLDPANPASAATTGDNDRDNVEQVLISSPAAGSYTITVTHKGASLAPSGSQAFSMVITGQGDEPSGNALVSLSLSTASIGGGNTLTGTVTLSGTGGGVVTLSSNNPAATVPASVTVPSGSTSANFTIGTSAVASTLSATITASKDGVDRPQNLQVRAASLVSVSMNPTSVLGGASSTGTVTVSGNIPAGGITVSLSDDNANAATPASVLIPEGQTSATFTVTTNSVASTQTATISATFDGGLQSATLSIQAPAVVNLSTLTVSPTSVRGGNPSTGTVTLTGPAPAGGAVVNLSDNSIYATTPATVTVPQGATSATFTITTTRPNRNQTATITATRNSVTRTATLQIRK